VRFSFHTSGTSNNRHDPEGDIQSRPMGSYPAWKNRKLIMRVCKAQDTIKGYKIIEHLNTGAMANAYAAVSPDGGKVFLKQYKSPAVSVNWFKPYVEYQKELNRRVGEPSLKRFCVHQIDAFVEPFGPPTFFQVYEFIEGGHDLGTILDTIRKDPAA